MKAQLIAAMTCGLLMSTVAQAAEVKVLSSAAVKEILLELTPQFEKSSANKVTTTWAGTVDIKKQIEAGDPFDLVIVGAQEIDAFIAGGKLVAGSRVDLAKSGVGVAVKAGAPRPDISSADAVKKALLSAQSVAYSTGPSGVYIQRLFEKLGIADAMKAKAKQTAPGIRVGQYIARGEADIGFQQVSELIHEDGIDFLGPLPPDIQNFTVFSSGILSGSKEPDAAKKLQTFFATPAAAPIIEKNGMEPEHS